MTMEKWDVLERILIDNQLSDLLESIYLHNKWDQDIRITINEALL